MENEAHETMSTANVVEAATTGGRSRCLFGPAKFCRIQANSGCEIASVTVSPTAYG